MKQNHPIPRWLAVSTGAVTVLLAVLLCLQWPLRDWVQAHNRTVNDWGQLMFALLMVCAIGVASRQGTHLSAHAATSGWLSPPRRRAWALLACVLPWAAVLLWASLKPMSYAMVHLERFPESSTAGYWMIHLAVTLLALVALVQSSAMLRRSLRESPALAVNPKGAA
jgi:hypothetical protein